MCAVTGSIVSHGARHMERSGLAFVTELLDPVAQNRTKRRRLVTISGAILKAQNAKNPHFQP